MSIDEDGTGLKVDQGQVMGKPAMSAAPLFGPEDTLEEAAEECEK